MALLRIELRLALEQSALFTWHVLRLPIEFFNQRYTGDLVSRVEANDRIATLVARDFGTIAASCITALFLGVVMVFYDAILAAIAHRRRRHQHRGAPPRPSRAWRTPRCASQTERGRLFAASVVGLQSIETLKATGTENDFFARWTGYHTRATNSEQQLAVLQQATNLVPPIVFSLTSAAVLGIGALQVVDGDLTRRHAGGLPDPADEFLRPDPATGRRRRAWSSRHRPTWRASTMSCTTGATGASPSTPARRRTSRPPAT